MRVQARKHQPFTTTVLWWACGLLLALAPILGQMHRVLHTGHGVTPLAAALHAQQHRSSHDSSLSRLFGLHSAADCLVLDQWTWANPSTHLATRPSQAPATPVPAQRYWHPGAIHVAAFQARAPPPFWLG